MQDPRLAAAMLPWRAPYRDHGRRAVPRPLADVDLQKACAQAERYRSSTGGFATTDGRASNVACHAASCGWPSRHAQLGEPEIQIRQRDADRDMADRDALPPAHPPPAPAHRRTPAAWFATAPYAARSAAPPGETARQARPARYPACRRPAPADAARSVVPAPPETASARHAACRDIRRSPASCTGSCRPPAPASGSSQAGSPASAPDAASVPPTTVRTSRSAPPARARVRPPSPCAHKASAATSAASSCPYHMSSIAAVWHPARAPDQRRNAMNWIEVNGTSLRYELSGSGKTTLVLVHEMGGTLDSWDQVLPALNNARRCCATTRVAPACQRRSAARLRSTTWQTTSRHCWMRSASPARSRIAGTAVGGAIAIYFAVRHAARVGALVVTSPATGVPADRRQATLDRAAAAETKGMRGIVDAEFRQLLSARGPPQRRGLPQIPRALAGQRSAELRRDQSHARGFDGDRRTAAHRLSHAGDRLHARQAAPAISDRADGEADSRRGIP